jgi:hypothetical protein
MVAAMGIEERSRERRTRIEAHRAASFEDAEAWDLEFWQRRSPEERLSALVAIRPDVALAEAARRQGDTPEE